MIVSFAWTTDALLAGQKKRTRRSWNDDYAMKFRVAGRADAYNQLPRVGGHKVGDLNNLSLFKQRTSLMTEEDYELEGLKYMEANGLFIPVRTAEGKRVPAMHPRRFFEEWRLVNELVWVLDFEFKQK